MKLLILIIALCVVAAYAVPNINDGFGGFDAHQHAIDQAAQAHENAWESASETFQNFRDNVQRNNR
ncbi:hypothetical protein HA402_002424 [Bradysia odoriphaga]|nr:hypothetical protein HA402_002424 [Bradysia odoriphaga]